MFLIIGANGFVGREVASVFEELGIRYATWFRSRDSNRDVSSIVISLDIKVVIVAAGKNGWSLCEGGEGFFDQLEKECDFIRSILFACAKSRSLERIIYLSSISSERKWSMYGHYKRSVETCFENYSQDLGLDRVIGFTIIRLSSIYSDTSNGRKVSLIRWVRDRGPLLRCLLKPIPLRLRLLSSKNVAKAILGIATEKISGQFLVLYDVEVRRFGDLLGDESRQSIMNVSFEIREGSGVLKSGRSWVDLQMPHDPNDFGRF